MQRIPSSVKSHSNFTWIQIWMQMRKHEVLTQHIQWRDYYGSTDVNFQANTKIAGDFCTTDVFLSINNLILAMIMILWRGWTTWWPLEKCHLDVVCPMYVGFVVLSIRYLTPIALTVMGHEFPYLPPPVASMSAAYLYLEVKCIPCCLPGAILGITWLTTEASMHFSTSDPPCCDLCILWILHPKVQCRWLMILSSGTMCHPSSTNMGRILQFQPPGGLPGALEASSCYLRYISFLLLWSHLWHQLKHVSRLQALPSQPTQVSIWAVGAIMQSYITLILHLHVM